MSGEATPDVLVEADALASFVEQVFATIGVRGDDAALLAEILVTADLRGVHTHGVSFLPRYVERITSHQIDPVGVPRVIGDDGAVILVDANNAMGHLAAAFAMREAIGRARSLGVAAVSVRNSNHCGALAYYPMMALSEDMIGLAT
ncbi:MAG: Ldh family oxidoreductase, partial [Candidatus Dormibacteria bacterium]